MTVKEYCEENDITVKELMKLWDKKKFKSFDSYLNSEYKWKPKFNVGDIVIDRDGDISLILDVLKHSISYGFLKINALEFKNNTIDYFQKEKYNLLCEYDFFNNDVKIGTYDKNELKKALKFYNEIKYKNPKKKFSYQTSRLLI